MNKLRLVEFIVYNNFSPRLPFEFTPIPMQKIGLYGYLSGMASSVILQPLDNIKMVLMMPPKQINFSHNFVRNAYLSLKYLANDQGLRSFYKGLTPNIAKNGFGSAVYFYSLRLCEEINKKYQFSDQNSFVTNFVISSLGRVFSSIASNPFVILETRYEMAGKERWSGSLVNGLKKLYVNEGTKGCFRGCLTNCYKEGMFAGLFYGMYEEGKKLGYNSSVSGIISGMIATLISHPLQIVRTQLQTSSVYVSPHGQWLQMSIKDQLIELARQGQLLKGVSPRLIKKPLANTITFLMFEALEKQSLGCQ